MVAHSYSATVSWSGTTSVGVRAYDRTHVAELTPGAELSLSADASFRGNEDLPNPEQLLVTAAGSCLLLSFLGAATRAGIDVVGYTDRPRGRMPGDVSPMSITEIELTPLIRVRDADPARVAEVVAEAHDQCFIANSLRSAVSVVPTIEVEP